jgi:hypothetical protein
MDFDVQVLFSGGVGSRSSLLHVCLESGWPCRSRAVSCVSMKYLKPSRLRNAFFSVVSLVSTVALNSVAPMAAAVAGHGNLAF